MNGRAKARHREDCVGFIDRFSHHHENVMNEHGIMTTGLPLWRRGTSAAAIILFGCFLWTCATAMSGVEAQPSTGQANRVSNVGDAGDEASPTSGNVTNPPLDLGPPTPRASPRVLTLVPVIAFLVLSALLAYLFLGKK